MARRFNGSSDVVVFTLPVALQALDAGPMTMAVAVKMNGLTDGAFIHTRTSGGTNSWWMECASSQWNYGQGVAARDVGDLSTSDGWTVLIGRKADGGANTPTGRKIILGGGTTNVTAPSALADGTAPGAGGVLQVGKWGTAAEYIDADIAACAVWNTVLSDGDAATLTTYAAWLALTPLWIVAFDQASATDPIDDDSSGGTGDSSSVTGTTIVADPGGFFGGHTAALGTAAEADSAVALARRKIRALGVTAETDTAVALARTKTKALGTATSAEVAQPLGRTKSRALGVSSETDAALPIAASGAHVVGTALEADLALPVGRTKQRALGVATCTETAQPIGRRKSRPLGTAAEADAALHVVASGGASQAATRTLTEGPRRKGVTPLDSTRGTPSQRRRR